MCTAITYKTKDHYFGRTLDHELSYSEEVTVTPRNYPLPFRHGQMLNSHYAIIGMAHVMEGYPLYFDAANEKGLAMAGLNFVGNTHYRMVEPNRNNVASFELIPWVLAQCATVQEAEEKLSQINVTDTPFSDALQPSELHWMIADRKSCIVVEALRDGIHIYDDPAGVLTNNPTFDDQMFQLNNYMHLSPYPPENRFSSLLDLKQYSRGMGAMGLPGDLSSQSRFVRAVFTKLNSVCGTSEAESVSQFFHILGAVAQTRGCCRMEEDRYEWTVYTACCNTDKGIYYYTTYENNRITAVNMHRENLEGEFLIRYPLMLEQSFLMQNG